MSAYVELWVQDARDRIALSGDRIAIGQAASNDISLPFDRAVSRLHAVLENLPSGCQREFHACAHWALLSGMSNRRSR